MSKDKQQVQQDNQGKTHVNKPVQEEINGLETAVVNPIPALQRAHMNPRTLSPADAQTLQRTIGNQALGRLIIQRKMTVGPVGDKYEQEADAVAKQVVSKLHAPPTQSPPTQTTQRQEEEELQMSPLVQRQEEEELQMKSIQRQEEEDELQMKPLPIISSLQRQEEEELQAKSETTKGDPMLAGGELSSDVESSVQSAKSSGQPMSDNLRAPMEQAFNADFSNVKIHTDQQADRLNRAMSARAFTSGQDVFFRSGEYNPNSNGGQELIAHELTHTIQQGAAQMSTMQMKRIVDANQISSASAQTIQRAFGFGSIVDWVKGWLGLGQKPSAKAAAPESAPAAGPQPEPQVEQTPAAEEPEPQPASEPEPEPAAPGSDAPDEAELAKAFHESTFYYGTVGGAETLKSVIKAFQDGAKAKAKARGEEFNKPYYWPGARAKPYLEHLGGASPASTGDRAHKGPVGENDSNAQMMDLYYGEGGTTVHELRNPAIGKYVHEQMGYKGDYEHDKSGRDAYKETYGNGSDGAEGWKWPNQKWGAEGEQSALWHHPDTGAALTGTMEISRIIRDGVAKYGGKLVFDGKHVIHKSNFVDGTYQGDTNKEARALFEDFAAHPGESEVPFGKGTLIFHWGGKQVVPTQALFRSHWDLLASKWDTPSGEDVAGPQTATKVAQQVPPESIFWKFPKGVTEKSDKEIGKERLATFLAGRRKKIIALGKKQN